MAAARISLWGKCSFAENVLWKAYGREGTRLGLASRFGERKKEPFNEGEEKTGAEHCVGGTIRALWPCGWQQEEKTWQKKNVYFFKWNANGLWDVTYPPQATIP